MVLLRIQLRNNDMGKMLRVSGGIRGLTQHALTVTTSQNDLLSLLFPSQCPVTEFPNCGPGCLLQ